MPYYRTCPDCGSSLDPGEICDCQDKEEAALDATNIQSGYEEDGESPKRTVRLYCIP